MTGSVAFARNQVLSPGYAGDNGAHRCPGKTSRGEQMRARATALAVMAAAALGIGATTAGAAGPPPPPTAPGGQTVTQVAAGLKTPTSFAFGAGKVFEGDGGNSSGNKPPDGGVYLLADGKGVKLAGSPLFVSGLAWHQNALYVAGGLITKKG